MKKILICTLALTLCTPGLAMPGDGKFTIAAIPDTQNYMDYTHQTAEGFPFDAREMFFEQMEYIAANVESQGGEIAFVTGLGDVWQHQTMTIDPDHYMRGFRVYQDPALGKIFAPIQKVWDVEMPAARKGYELLTGKVPFSVVPGNHDYDAVWTNSKFPSTAKVDPGDKSTIGVRHPGGLSNFRAVFGEHTPFFKGRDWYVAANDGGADSAQVFEAEGYKFLHIGLQFDPPNSSLEWAARVMEAHKGLPTIISTHDYLNTVGERAAYPTIDSNKVDLQDNSPQMVWDKLISQHDQIFMVLCGHHGGQALRIDKNVSGYDVYQVLSNYQDRGQTALDAGVESKRPANIGDGWMRLMEFDFNGNEPVVKVRTYSSHYKKLSSQVREYAAWYRDYEDPGMSDKDFAREDEFTLTLSDFRKRFGTGKS
jgi:hypothetical protein